MEDHRDRPDLLIGTCGPSAYFAAVGAGPSMAVPKWLQAAADIFGLVYKSSDEGHRELSIALVKHHATDQHFEK